MLMRHVRLTTKNGETTDGYVYLDDGERIGLQLEQTDLVGEIERVEFDLADVRDLEPLADEYVEPVIEIPLEDDGEPDDVLEHHADE